MSAAGRPRNAPKQRRAARLGDHRLRVALAQRQRPQRKVAQHLDADAAQAERERQAEIRIARDAGEHLDAVGDHLLHEIAGDRPAERCDAALHLVEGSAEARLVREADRDQAVLRLVRDVVRHDLQDHRIADRRGGIAAPLRARSPRSRVSPAGRARPGFAWRRTR